MPRFTSQSFNGSIICLTTCHATHLDKTRELTPFINNKSASMATLDADKTAKSLPLHEMDTNILFEKFTVDEIREIEKKTRTDIERKKEDLRTMVGRKQEVQFYGVASQIKLLLDMPEKQSPQLLSWFPVLTRQWAAISHFRSTILQGCRSMLKEPVTTDKCIAECLCSIILLEDSTPRQVFNEFLLARTTAVQQLFHPNQQNASVKDQICTVVRLITTTVHQIHGVFYSGDSNNEENMNVPNNLLVSILTEVTSQKQQDSGLLELQGSIAGKCLPKSVTVKRLADIKDAVWELLSQDDTMVVWASVCQKILNNSLHMWQGFLQPLFLERVKALMKYQLDNATEMAKRQITKVVMEIGNVDDISLQSELNMANYIWMESNVDIPANMAWMTSNQRMASENPGGLMMKAKAYTPIVQSLCKTYDERLRIMLEDCVYYIQPCSSPDSDDQTNVKGPFDRYADKQHLLNHLTMSCEKSLEELLDYIKEQLTQWKKALEVVPDKSVNDITQNKILLVGRLCTGLSELAPSLQKCILGQSIAVNQNINKLQKKATPHGSSKTAEETAWTKSQKHLGQCQASAYRIWVDHLSSTVLKDFEVNLCSKEGPQVITVCTRWDEVDIQEETEDGKKISSKIKVPMQASWYVHSLLYYICQEINRVGGHALTRSVLQDLVYKISDGMMVLYENFIKDNRKKRDKSGVMFSQQRALQLLFDVKFLLLIIPRKDDLQESKLYQQRSQRVIDGLEERVDPFDLDVFSPFIQSNLTKHAQRSSMTDMRSTSLAETAAAVIPEPSPHKDSSSSFYNKLGSMSSMTELSNWFSNIGSKS
ncbi:hypothetical protein KUTeg_017903 [Tegillarca granosa]|uniref:Conserved oligomeric Golgi complex subunit 1 n=1 Tax=Tegillarca granosa TaxID=220873 RepID=A0ABQ9ELM9_TEGGR|nr:hypothetical protein KUTeg_017903 [Tegillarca granosa]